MEMTNILVVYDPTREAQPALERALSIAAEIPGRLYVFCCIHADIPRGADKATLVRQKLAGQRAVIEQRIAALNPGDTEVSIDMEWDRDWYRAVVRASISRNAGVVLKSTYKHTSSQRILNRSSDWTLIRECLCPVLLVREDSPNQVKKILAAIDVRAKSDAYQQINRHIIDFSQRILDSGEAELHFINAYSSHRDVPDRNQLVDRSGVASDRVHIRMGDPEEVIVQGAAEMEANLVVVGNSARTGLAAVMRGNTVEKVLDKLDCDVLSLP